MEAEEYRKFLITSNLARVGTSRAVATVTVETSDAQRVADLQTERFMHVERWVEEFRPEQLQVIVDECKQAIDHYVDNVDE
jgi:hypothetical protein